MSRLTAGRCPNRWTKFDRQFLEQLTVAAPEVRLLQTTDPAEVVRGAMAVYTDVWTSMGQESESDEQAAQSKGRPYTPSNILANLYRHLGIDPAATIPGFDGRPMHILDDRALVRELI